MSQYRDDEKQKEILKLREIMKELPYCMGEFFRSIAQNTSPKTRLGYAYDLRIFFHFWKKIIHILRIGR